jgi:hypothetical protein
MEHKGTHCKVNFNGEIRRFLFNGTSFQSLYCLIGTHFDLNGKTYGLKYLDEEGDKVTLSSDEELNYALKYLKDNLLRLQVEYSDATGTDTKVHVHSHEDKVYPHDDDHIGRGGKWRGGGHPGGRRGGRGRGGRGRRMGFDYNREDDEDNGQYRFRLQKKKEKLESMITVLESIDESEGKVEMRRRRIANLKEKLNIITIKLNDIDKSNTGTVTNNAGTTDSKGSDAVESKKRRKLTEEESKQLEAVKETIRKVKNDIDDKKSLILAKKIQIKEEKDNSKKSQYKDELVELKNEIFDLKKKLGDLRQQSFDIRKC